MNVDTSGANFDWNRSFSEPDLTDPFRHLNRFTIKHPHEYISVDDLKFFRRKRPPDGHTKSNVCLYNKDEPVLPFGSLISEYTKQFHHLDLGLKPGLLRRATSLRLEGLMHHQSEHQEQYHWYTPADWQYCRTYPIKNPESLHLLGDIDMDPEYRSSYISYPMIDRATKILPREMFRIDNEKESQHNHKKNLERSAAETAAINKLAQDKFKRDVAALEQQKCHLQQRASEADCNYNAMPSEYKRQFVPPLYPIEKAHSIPQISHFKMQGDFNGVAEYQDSYKMYASYSKSAPIKKVDNLRFSGAEVQAQPDEGTEVPEYRQKFCNPPKDAAKQKSLKTDDHLHPRGEFTKNVPEYYESFQDPQIKQMPERGKCREPYLRLKGKIEFNPEYRNTYLDFPRSRPIVRKPASSFRFPTSTTQAIPGDRRSPNRSPRRKYKSSSPNHFEYDPNLSTDFTATPEYRRAHYNYQIRERTPPNRQVSEVDAGAIRKYGSTSKTRKSSDSSIEAAGKPTGNYSYKKRPSRTSMVNTHAVATQSSFENVGSNASKKATKFGRRASVLQNAANCHDKSSKVEGNPKYTMTSRKEKSNRENQDSFVVLNECKGSNWMKKKWYES